VAPDLNEPSVPEGSSSDPVLQFLSQHRQGAEQRRGPNRRNRRRGRKTTLLGIVVALVLVGAGLLIWVNFASSQSASSQSVSQRAANSTAPKKRAKGTAKGSSRVGAASKTHKTAAVPGANEPWHRGLQPSGYSTRRRRLPKFYYQWLHPGYSCALSATYGCWKVAVSTRDGCPHGVMVVVEETQNGASVGATFGISRPLAPRARGVVELDKDQGSVGAQVDSMLCNSRKS